MTEKLTLEPAAENEEHLARHTDNTSLTPGSKAAYPNLKDKMKAILNACDKQYAQMIEEKGNPGRVVFGIEAPQKIGTDAVVPVSGLNNDAQIFSLPRDVGTEYERAIKAVLVRPEDMPKTNVVHAVYGPYGPTGKAGIYTVMFGDEGMPFPRPESPESTPEQKKFNDACRDYWNNHVFLVTPKEVENTITLMKEQGKDTKLVETNLRLFNHKLAQGTYQDPCNHSYHSRISPTAQRINLETGNTQNHNVLIPTTKREMD